MRLKDPGAIAKKFVQRASSSAGDYKSGVEQSGQDWLTNTSAAGQNFADGVASAIADKRFEKGVQEAGAGKFTQRASTLGAQRYPSGVGASEGDYARGVAPYVSELQSMQLPPRRPKGDPANFARSQAVAQRLRAIKVGK